MNNTEPGSNDLIPSIEKLINNGDRGIHGLDQDDAGMCISAQIRPKDNPFALFRIRVVAAPEADKRVKATLSAYMFHPNASTFMGLPAKCSIQKPWGHEIAVDITEAHLTNPKVNQIYKSSIWFQGHREIYVDLFQEVYRKAAESTEFLITFLSGNIGAEKHETESEDKNAQ